MISLIPELYVRFHKTSCQELRVCAILVLKDTVSNLGHVEDISNSSVFGIISTEFAPCLKLQNLHTVFQKTTSLYPRVRETLGLQTLKINFKKLFKIKNIFIIGKFCLQNFHKSKFKCIL